MEQKLRGATNLHCLKHQLQHRAQTAVAICGRLLTVLRSKRGQQHTTPPTKRLDNACEHEHMRADTYQIRLQYTAQCGVRVPGRGVQNWGASKKACVMCLAELE